jgi:SAM-dependent methyltransferase
MNHVPARADCYFYHTMDVPGYGLIEGEWDLRSGVDAYLGHEPVAGKRVLEVGTASGFLCFEMERRGADVIAYDLSPETSWDIVPYRRLDIPAVTELRARHIAAINNAWWLAHHAFGSHARVAYGSIYDIPAEIGAVDVCTLGSILLHVRDPLGALERVAKLGVPTLIVTEMEQPKRFGILRRRNRSPIFLPNGEAAEPFETWWSFSPEAIANLLAIVGYRVVRIVRHAPPYRKRPMPLFTVVAERYA